MIIYKKHDITFKINANKKQNKKLKIMKENLFTKN